jgi:hypothetical protein
MLGGIIAESAVLKARFYENHEGGLMAIDNSCIYYMGVIDIFTPYGVNKQFENFFRSVQYDSETISCVPPQ